MRFEVKGVRKEDTVIVKRKLKKAFEQPIAVVVVSDEVPTDHPLIIVKVSNGPADPGERTKIKGIVDAVLGNCNYRFNNTSFGPAGHSYLTCIGYVQVVIKHAQTHLKRAGTDFSDVVAEDPVDQRVAEYRSTLNHNEIATLEEVSATPVARLVELGILQ